MSIITPNHTNLAYSLTKHYFGQSVASVVKTLFNYDQASLKLICSNLPKTKVKDIKKSLLILVKYQLVDYVLSIKNSTQFCEYSIVTKRLFSFFRISKYIQLVVENEGPIPGIIMNILAENALLSNDKLIEHSINITKQNKPELNESIFKQQVCTTLESLILRRYLNHNIDISINIEKFDRHYRDNLVAHTLCHYYKNEEEKIYYLTKLILDLTNENTPDDATLTAPIPIMDIFQKLSASEFENCQVLDKYLKQLTLEESRFFVSCGRHDIKGQMYAINMGLVLDYMVKEHLSSIITTRFGPKCSRIFRVLIKKGPLLLKQIEEIIMLPARDVREYSYMLIKEGFIRNRQVSKTPDNAPGKSIFIMSVELDQVVYNASDLCCRAMNNLLVRYKYELEKNKLLLERSKAVEKLDNVDDSEYFNSHELNDLHQVKQTLDKILVARNQVDETLFLFHAWINIRRSLESDE